MLEEWVRLVAKTLTRGRNWSKSYYGILQHHWRPNPPLKGHCWCPKRYKDWQMWETYQTASALNQGGHSYHGAMQLYSIQLKCPRRVEKTEFRIALFQPARMQTLTSQIHVKQSNC